MVTDEEIAQAFIRYYTGGSGESDYWAVEEVSQLPIDNPTRAWAIIQLINKQQVEDQSVRDFLCSIVGCGVLEDIIALHENEFLSLIANTAINDEILRAELSAIYKEGVSSRAWAELQKLGG